MIFGSELDDDLFEISEIKKTATSTEYSPKVYNSEWYLQPDCDDMEEEHSTQLKSYADYLYYHHKYTACVEKYLECLRLLQSSNITVRRDCLEGIARSLLHQEHLSQALAYALQLLDVACNVDHRVVAWNLLASIYHQMGRYSDELDVLHSCLQCHSWNYDFWLRLAFCYSGLFGIKLNDEVQSKLQAVKRRKPPATSEGLKIILDAEKNETLTKCSVGEECEPGSCFLHNEENEKQPDLCPSFLLEHNLSKCQSNLNKISPNNDNVSNGKYSYSCSEAGVSDRCGTLIICACLVRARLLLQTCILGYRSFAQESNVWQQEQISLLLKTMDVEKDIVDHYTQVYLRDIGNEVVDSTDDKSVLDRLKEKKTGTEEEEPSIENMARRQFEKKWFGWLFTT